MRTSIFFPGGGSMFIPDEVGFFFPGNERMGSFAGAAGNDWVLLTIVLSIMVAILYFAGSLDPLIYTGYTSESPLPKPRPLSLFPPTKWF